MVNKLIRLLAVAVFMFFSADAFGQCEALIKDFYIAYMQNAEKNDGSNVELIKKHMSPELIAKVAEFTSKYDADAMIHAQDVSKYGIESLVVEPLGSEDGYMVKYKWSPESEYTWIVVQAVSIDGKLQFKDIFSVGTEAEGKSYIKRTSYIHNTLPDPA